jgi:hypothetical protein
LGGFWGLLLLGYQPYWKNRPKTVIFGVVFVQQREKKLEKLLTPVGMPV